MLSDIEINDNLLQNSSFITYNIVNDPNKGENAFTYKHYPDKGIIVRFPTKNETVDIWFDPSDYKWKSSSISKDKKHISSLSPEQMYQFFNTNFFSKLIQYIKKVWPLSDKFFSNLYRGVLQKRYGSHIPEITNENTNEEDMLFPTSKMKFIADNVDIIFDANGNPICDIRFTYNDRGYSIHLPPRTMNKTNGWRFSNIDNPDSPIYADPIDCSRIAKTTIIFDSISKCRKKIKEEIKLLNDSTKIQILKDALEDSFRADNLRYK